MSKFPFETLQAAEQFFKVVQFFAASLPEDRAMEVSTIYDPWKPDKLMKKGTYVVYGKNGVGDPQLYRVEQEHTSQADWTPDKTAALYTAIGLTDAGYTVWSPPTGGHDAYNEGDIVDHEGTLYISNINGNTTVPGSDDRWWSVYTP